MDCKHPTDKLIGYDKGVVCLLCGKTFTAQEYGERQKPAAKPQPRKRTKKEE